MLRHRWFLQERTGRSKTKLTRLKQNKLKLKDSYDFQHKANPTEWEERQRALGLCESDRERFLVDVCSIIDWTYEDMMKVFEIAERTLQKELGIAEYEFTLDQAALHNATKQ